MKEVKIRHKWEVLIPGLAPNVYIGAERKRCSKCGLIAVYTRRPFSKYYNKTYYNANGKELGFNNGTTNTMPPCTG